MTEQGHFSARIASLTPEQRTVLEREIKKEVSSAPPIPRRSLTGPCALSFAQQRLWFLDQFAPGSSVYNLFTGIPLPGLLDKIALAQALNEIVRRHEVLRTAFAVVDLQPAQIIAPALTLNLNVVDLRHLPLPFREQEAQRFALSESQSGFDLSQSPLLRANLLQLSDDNHILLLTMHHIISDGWSLGLLFNELAVLYQAYATGNQSPLPELSIQYADYSEWQRQFLQGDVLDALLSSWKERLDGAPPVMALPADRPRGAVIIHSGATQPFQLSFPTSEALRSLARREGATLFMILLAAFKTLIHRYTGETDVVIGAPIANRNRAEIEDLIGFFVNTLVLRTDLSGNPTFRELLDRVREVTLEAYARQDLPFEKLVEELQPERSLSHHPLFQVAFAFQNVPTLSPAMYGQTSNQPQIMIGTAKFDLSLAVAETEHEIVGAIEYSTALFDGDTIGRLIGNLQTLLERIVDAPDTRLSDFAILTDGERRQLLQEWNATYSDVIHGTSFHQLFEEQVEKRGNKAALVFGDLEISYRELNRRANQCARQLREMGVGRETIVAICAKRSPEMVIAILGILKAGGAFLPLDAAYPLQRLTFMLRDAGVQVLATQSTLAGSLREHVSQVILLDQLQGGSDENPDTGVTSDNLAYVIYTSGSTGQPKGVLLSHEGLCNVVQAQIRLLGVRPEDRVLQFASLSFDAAIFEIVMALATGATLYLASREELLPGPALNRLLREMAITTVTLPPSALAVMPHEELPSLRNIIVAGERCSADLAQRWANSRRLFNAYGPTETTIWATVFECRNADTEPPIGRPIDNTKVYLLDASLQPVPIGGLGEICIGGAGVARGYLNNPKWTAERFIPDPFGGGTGARLYRTGDVGRYRRDGSIQFLGRMDQQLKLRGFRIEPGEIEATLQQHPAVKQVAVIAREDTPGDKRVVAYVEQRDGQPAIPAELRSFSKLRLPEYMVPSAFVVLESLPLTPSGKINRSALPIPGSARTLKHQFVAPEGPVEEVLGGIWAEILGLDQVGRHDNFFELGGHSLLATQVVSRVRELLLVELWVRQLFETPTVAELSAAILANFATERVETTAQLILRLTQLTDEEATKLLSQKSAASSKV